MTLDKILCFIVINHKLITTVAIETPKYKGEIIAKLPEKISDLVTDTKGGRVIFAYHINKSLSKVKVSMAYFKENMKKIKNR